MYNTLDSVNALMDSGFTHQQAQAMVTVMTDNLATKEDIEVLRRDMKDGNDKLETSLRSDMEGMETSLRSDMEKMETSLRSDMEGMETSLRSDMEKMETTLSSDMEKMETSLRSDMEKIETTLSSGLQEMKVRFDYQFLFLKWVGAISVGGILTISATAFTLLRLLP